MVRIPLVEIDLSVTLAIGGMLQLKVPMLMISDGSDVRAFLSLYMYGP